MIKVTARKEQHRWKYTESDGMTEERRQRDRGRKSQGERLK